jgi:hypothetical protein
MRKFKMQQHLQKDSVDAGGYCIANREKLRQFHDLQRNIHQLITKTLVLVIEAKNKKYKFRTIRAKSRNVGETTGIGVASDFTTCQ